MVETRPSLFDESVVRRWCWIEPWLLCSQDEDLFVMSDQWMVPLLDEAANGCTKRDYALRIVAHHVRDQAHATLRNGSDALRAKIGELLNLRAAARAANDEGLVAYLNRLDSHVRPQKVGREDAIQRVSDLWRCAAPAEVLVEQDGDAWRAKISGSTRAKSGS